MKKSLAFLFLLCPLMYGMEALESHLLVAAQTPGAEEAIVELLSRGVSVETTSRYELEGVRRSCLLRGQDCKEMLRCFCGPMLR